MDIIKPVTLDILDLKAPALSTTSDMPVETNPDPLPEEVKVEAVPSAEVAEEAEQLEESATSTTEKPGQPAPRGVGKKIAELTKRAADAEAAKKQAEDNLKAALELKAKADTAPVVEEDPEPVKPSKDSFSDPDAYDAAWQAYADQKAAHTARKEVRTALADHESNVQQQQFEEQQRRTIESYLSRVEKTKTKYADFDEVAYSPDVMVSPVVKMAIELDEQGPEIQYYLGTHKEEAAALLPLSAPIQLLKLGQIISKLSAPKPAVSNAPAPIKALKNSTEVTKTAEEETMDEYAARRTKEIRAQMRH